MKKTCLAFLLLATPALCAQNAPDFSVKVERLARSAIKLTVLPPAGHHINIEAPMDLLVTHQKAHVKPAQARAALVVFRAPDYGANEYVLSLFLCDEHNTYCEKHQVTVKWNADIAAQTPTAALETAGAQSSATPAKKSAGVTMLHGFILNNPQAALAKALKEKRPLLIDFFGIWCPPCNMLDESVFSSEEFRKASSGFIKLKLDSDSAVSWELKSKYKVSGYPTVVLTTSDGDELSRIVGFRPRALFVKEVTSVWNSRTEPYAKLKEKADAGDAAASGKVGLIHLSRHEYALAETYLAKAPEQKEALADAQVGLLTEKADAGDKDSEDKLVQILEQATTAYPASFNSMDRRQKLADLYESRKQTDKRTEQLKRLIATAEKFAADPALRAGHDAIPGDLWETIAEAYEKLGQVDDARKAYRKGFDEYGKELNTVAHGKSADTERGYNLERAYCLWKAGDAKAADTLYTRLEKRFPEEFTFYFGHARMSLDIKNLEAAQVLSRKALKYSYGDNKLRAAQLVGKVFDAAGKPKEGLELVREALKTVKLPDDKSIRTHRYYKQLQDLEQKLAQGAL